MLVSLFFTVILAQVAAAPTPVPNPTLDLSTFAYMQGTWTCHSMLRGKDRPDTYTGSIGLNGRYVVAHDTAPPFDQYRSNPVHSEMYFTYDPQAKMYVSTEMDDFGGYGFATSPGWQGNSMVWTDKSAQDGTVAITTITKVSDSEYNMRSTGTDGKGKPVPVTTATCKKS
jgi:hypothetical protein